MRRAVSLCTLVAALACAPAASAADFTWGGGGGNWSAGASWLGGVAPSGTVGTLIFPSAACVQGCPTTMDDVSGLTAATISIRGKRPGADEEKKAWILNGTAAAPLTLTAGLDAALSSPGSANDGAAHLALPIVLGADNVWTVDGAVLSSGQDFGVTGDHGLSINLTNGARFSTGGKSIEVGPVTVSGGGTVDLEQQQRGPGVPPGPSPSLNGGNGNPVTITSAMLHTAGAVNVGALSATNATIRLNSGSLATSSVTLDAASTLILQDGGNSAATVGKVTSQLTSTGAIDLGGARFTLYPDPAMCAQANGAVFTLVSTTGPLNGTFASLPDGAVMPSPEPGAQAPCGGAAKAMRINYHPADTPRTVTATLQPAAAATPPPKSTTPTPTPTPTPGYGPAAAAEGKKISETLSVLPLPKKSDGKQAKFVIPANALPPGTQLRLALLTADGSKTVGAKTVTIKGGTPTTIRVPLSKQAHKQLRKKGKLKLKVSITVVTPSGSKGGSTRKLTLRRS
jgi:hypothetical protein